MTGHGDDDRLRILLQDLIDQRELLLWPQRGLDDNDIVGMPNAGSGVVMANRLHGCAKPPAGRESALREHQVVLDHEEMR